MLTNESKYIKFQATKPFSLSVPPQHWLGDRYNNMKISVSISLLRYRPRPLRADTPYPLPVPETLCDIILLKIHLAIRISNQSLQ